MLPSISWSGMLAWNKPWIDLSIAENKAALIFSVLKSDLFSSIELLKISLSNLWDFLVLKLYIPLVFKFKFILFCLKDDRSNKLAFCKESSLKKCLLE